MRKTRLLTLLVLLMTAATGAWAQEVIPETLDFTSNSWGIPSGSEEKTADENSYTSGGYTITLCGSSGNGYYFSPTEPYILLGKQGAYLQLPAFSSAVDSIKVVGSPNASTAVEQNIYVGDVAVSTATTGMKNVTQKYVIAENYRTAGTIYRIKVTSANNTQITKVLVYFAPEPTYTVEFAEGTEESGKWTASPAADVTKGQTVTVTYTGSKKVLGVKAEKKAKTPALQTVNIGGDTSATLYYLPGETFGQAIANHPENTSFEINGDIITCNGYWLFIGYYDGDVTPNTLVEANGDYRGLPI